MKMGIREDVPDVSAVATSIRPQLTTLMRHKGFRIIVTFGDEFCPTAALHTRFTDDA